MVSQIHSVAPSPFKPSEVHADWHNKRRARERPGTFYFNRSYLTARALDALPRFVAAVGLGARVGQTIRPKWWPFHALDDAAVVLHHLRQPVEAVVWFRLTPDSFSLLGLDQHTGEWCCSNECMDGNSSMSLACWRWGSSEVGAAKRLIQLLNLPRGTL
jgi:hypothetical protein